MHHEHLGLAAVIDPDAGPVAGAMMYEALRSLSPEQRSAIVQAYYFNASLQDISRSERTSDTAIKARLHDALRALHVVAMEGGIS